MKGYIYKIQNKKDGKCYIGKTKRYYEKRIREHFRLAYLENSQIYFHQKIRENDISDFICECIEVVECEDSTELMNILRVKEKECIDKYDSFKNGYNFFNSRYNYEERFGEITYTMGDIGEPIVRQLPNVRKKYLTLYDLNGNVIRQFSGATEASEYLGVTKSYISNCTSGRNDFVKQYVIKPHDVPFDHEYYKNRKPNPKRKRLMLKDIIK